MREGLSGLTQEFEDDGDLKFITVASPSEYQAALNNQRGQAHGLFIEITADISGSRNTVPYTWEAGRWLYVRKLSDTVRRAWRVGQGSGQGSGQGLTPEQLEQFNEYGERIDDVENKTSDTDLAVDSSTWNAAPSSEAQITVIPTTSTLHGQIRNRTFEPANLSPSQVWSTTLTTSAIDDIVLLRLQNGLDNLRYRYTDEGEPEEIYEHSRLPNADDTYTYYNLALFAANLPIALEKRQDVTHTIFKGELDGRAKAQYEAADSTISGRIDGIDIQIDQLETADDDLDDRIDETLDRTAVLKPLTVWERTNDARTIYFLYKPLQAVHMTTNITVIVGGNRIPNLRLSEGLAALDDVGVILSVPIDATQAANITNSSNARAGYIRCDIEVSDADTITDWMRTEAADTGGGGTSVAGTPPRAITGTSNVYTLLDEENQIYVEVNPGGSQNRRLTKIILRAELTSTAKDYVLNARNVSGPSGDADNIVNGFHAVSYTHLTLPTICSV